MRINLVVSNSEKPSDEALLRAVANGDRRAFDDLYRRSFQRVFGFAMRISGRADLADDIVAETMLAVWKGASSFEGRSKASTWIFGIAYRTSLAALRRTKRDADIDAAAAELEPASYSDIDTLFVQDQVARALAQLSPVHRATIELTYTYGHSVAETARIMQCPEGTVKTRMMHARAKLRALIAQEEAPRSEDRRP